MVGGEQTLRFLLCPGWAGTEPERGAGRAAAPAAPGRVGVRIVGAPRGSLGGGNVGAGSGATFLGSSDNTLPSYEHPWLRARAVGTLWRGVRWQGGCNSAWSRARLELPWGGSGGWEGWWARARVCGGGERPVLPLPGGTPPSDTTRPPWPCRWSLGDGGELRGPHLRQRLPPAAGEPAAAPGGDECLGTPPTATHLPWQPPGEREAPQVRVGRFRSGDGQQRPLASHPFGFREQLLP